MYTCTTLKISVIEYSIIMLTELNYKIKTVDAISPEAIKLSQELFIELEEIYGKRKIEDFMDENKIFLYFIIIFLEEDKPAASGALKYFDPFSIEIKRMYVKKEARGKGLSKLILLDLESKAKEMNYKRIVLETGVRQPEAINLYEKFGYKRMKCYGRFADDPESVCYEKTIE